MVTVEQIFVLMINVLVLTTYNEMLLVKLLLWQEQRVTIFFSVSFELLADFHMFSIC